MSYGGKKVLFQSLKHVDSQVSRSVEQLVPNQVSGGDRILILGPARYPTDEEWDRLYDAVRHGGSVVFAAQSHDSHVDTGPFGARVVQASPVENTVENFDDFRSLIDDDSEDSNPLSEEHDRSDFFSNLLGNRRATSDLISGDVQWQSSGEIEMDHKNDWDVLVESGTAVQAVQCRIGNGIFTLIASDEIFCNGAMLDPQRALLGWRILESAELGNETYFDESLNSTGVPKVLGLLFDPLFRPITLQLFLILVLFGWLGSRRFGPVQRSRHGRRRSVVEHAEAVGSLYYRSGAGAHAVHCLHEYLKQELRSRFGQGFQVENAERVAQQARADQQVVQKLFNEIGQLTDTKGSSATASRLLKGLSELLAAIQHRAEGTYK